jgi:DNA-binding PadR family transcriptional regulator
MSTSTKTSKPRAEPAKRHSQLRLTDLDLDAMIFIRKKAGTSGITGDLLIRDGEAVVGRRFAIGSAYAILNRLVKRGMVARSKKNRDVGGGRPASVFRLTDAGRSELNSRLRRLSTAA